MADKMSRRPLTSRGSGWAKGITKALAATSISPNQVSQASMLAAALAGVAFWFSGDTGDAVLRGALLVGAAVFCQLRLLCNLFDGLLAIEAGKSAPDGAFWNEFPDRVADILILVGAGYAVGEVSLGWTAAAFAVFTAYVRELGGANGMPADFSGPMAKPHRMAAITLAAVIAALEPLWHGQGEVLTIALWVITIGSGVTTFRRALRLRAWLCKGKEEQ
ncbi:CDP-alcohol phosphatidyltransferase family protein [Denitrobaculum tricleocarpae]|uniref:CDP-alcohol phosphatidyltransferase family protein n=1 Tax=Denitrobaculum tricleocarpae TaxID=2591009 RepID=A0A545TT30_9PROT|nr:CDP-alcohol phosphatidyltransferase family protein [Denitrobaculum tricleocarpae]TQV80377.1 CDP-alcohol phosphatidyltransferase family protein [Denitrobaculum tricleocarpae]